MNKLHKILQMCHLNFKQTKQTLSYQIKKLKRPQYGQIFQI